MINLKERLSKISKKSTKKTSTAKPKIALDIRKRLEACKKHPPIDPETLKKENKALVAWMEKEIDNQILEQKKKNRIRFYCRIMPFLTPRVIDQLIRLYDNAGWNVEYISGNQNGGVLILQPKQVKIISF